MDNRSKRRVVRTHQYIKGIYERQKAVRRGSLPESSTKSTNSRAESPVANFRKKHGTSTPSTSTMEYARPSATVMDSSHPISSTNTNTNTNTNSTVANMSNEDLVENLTDENTALIKSPAARHPTNSSNRAKFTTSVVGSPTHSERDNNNYGSVA